MIGSNLRTRDVDAADGGDQGDAAELAVELGVVGAGIGDEPAIEPRRAVPLQRIEIIEHRIEFVFETELDQASFVCLGAGIEAIGLVDLGAQDLRRSDRD